MFLCGFDMGLSRKDIGGVCQMNMNKKSRNHLIELREKTVLLSFSRKRFGLWNQSFGRKIRERPDFQVVVDVFEFCHTETRWNTNYQFFLFKSVQNSKTTQLKITVNFKVATYLLYFIAILQWSIGNQF